MEISFKEPNLGF